MSYIAFELDALNRVPLVASAARVSPGDVSYGLLLLWAWCFREEVDRVSDVQLAGFFGRDLNAELEAFGFIARSEAKWRVCGATRYLRVKNAQREGGKKGRALSSSTRGAHKVDPEDARKVDPEVSPGSTLRKTVSGSPHHFSGSTLGPTLSGPCDISGSHPGSPSGSRQGLDRPLHRTPNSLAPTREREHEATPARVRDREPQLSAAAAPLGGGAPPAGPEEAERAAPDGATAARNLYGDLKPWEVPERCKCGVDHVPGLEHYPMCPECRAKAPPETPGPKPKPVPRTEYRMPPKDSAPNPLAAFAAAATALGGQP
jgi:hypothetical protein